LESKGKTLKYQNNELENDSKNPNDFTQLLNFSSFSNNRYQKIHNLNSYQYINPVYYPVLISENGETIALPYIDMGPPLYNSFRLKYKKKINDCVFPPINSKKTKDITNDFEKFKKEEEERIKKEEEERLKREEEERLKKEEEEKKKNEKKNINWWELAKNFVLIYNFWKTCNKNIKLFQIRNEYIKERNDSIKDEIKKLKKWIISLEKPFLSEFIKYDSINLKLKENESKKNIKRKSGKIMKLIKKFMENLIGNSETLSYIPNEIRKILYNYIKENAYFAKNYLSIFQLNRLDFNFYGATKNMNDERRGLILAYLIICGISVQQILLYIHEIIKGFNNPYIINNSRYIGSLLHYLTRYTFSNHPKKLNNVLSLLNYYNNYKEKKINENEIFYKKVIYEDDMDQFSEFLESKSQFIHFYNENHEFVETYEKFIYIWAINLSKSLNSEFSNKNNLK
jgi:gas vesicle protein